MPGLGENGEVCNNHELEKALAVDAEIIGINNRDLTNFKVDLNTSLNLRGKIPSDRIVISESGIKSRRDVEKLENSGIDAILIGETLMRSEDKKACIEKLLT